MWFLACVSPDTPPPPASSQPVELRVDFPPTFPQDTAVQDTGAPIDTQPPASPWQPNPSLDCPSARAPDQLALPWPMDTWHGDEDCPDNPDRRYRHTGVDLDGDGVKDLVQTGDCDDMDIGVKHWVWWSGAEGWSTPREWALPDVSGQWLYGVGGGTSAVNWYVDDTDADCALDLVVRRDDGVVAHAGVAGGFASTTHPVSDVMHVWETCGGQKSTRRTTALHADLDGDGWDELVIEVDDCDLFDIPDDHIAFVPGSQQGIADTDGLLVVPLETDCERWLARDLAPDGGEEIRPYRCDDAAFEVARHSADGFVDPVPFVHPEWSCEGLTGVEGDVNGDGWVDFIGPAHHACDAGWQVALGGPDGVGPVQDIDLPEMTGCGYAQLEKVGARTVMLRRGTLCEGDEHLGTTHWDVLSLEP